jgi:hypothetical protein
MGAGCAARASACVGGFFFTAISLVFVGVGLWMTIRSIHTFATYQPAAAVVEKAEGTDPAADKTTLTYSYVVGGQRYTGSESAAEDSKQQFRALRQYKIGAPLTIYYNPRHPAESQVSVTPQTFGLGFATFALPFLAIGLSSIWMGLTGREVLKTVPMGSGSALGGPRFLVFVGTCVGGAAAQFALGIALPWPWSLAACLAVLLVAIPGANLYVAKLIARRRARKEAALREERRHATSAASRRSLEAQDDLEADRQDADRPAVPLGSLRKKLAIAIGVTVFWCGITSVFVYLAVGSLVKHQYAKLYFQPTDGTVLSSKVKTHSDSDSTTVSALIKYRYVVRGQEYIGDKYDFLGGSSSDGSYAYKAVNDNPPGKSIVVYYNPSRPSEAILRLEAPASSYFLLLFLQPFILIGLLMIGWCVTLPWVDRRLRRFLEDAPSPPWRIPGWGVMEQDSHGVVIKSKANWLAPLGHFMLGYGFTCFAGIFIVGFLFHGFGDANPVAIRWAFILAAAVGAAAMARKLALMRGGSQVEIDEVRKLLAVRSHKRDVEAPWAQIRSLRLRKVNYPAGMNVNGQSMRYLLLEATTNGEPVPIHAFKVWAGQEGELRAIAGKAQRALAERLGVTAAKTVAPAGAEDGEVAGHPSNPVGAIKQVAALIGQSRRRGGYSDLC